MLKDAPLLGLHTSTRQKRRRALPAELRISLRRRAWGVECVATAWGFGDYAKSIRHWLQWEAYRLCGDWHEAEDLVQETLHKVSRRWEHLGERDVLGGYTHRTLLHTFISERRRPRWTYETSDSELIISGRTRSGIACSRC
jgi:hypothetical protein